MPYIFWLCFFHHFLMVVYSSLFWVIILISYIFWLCFSIILQWWHIPPFFRCTISILSFSMWVFHHFLVVVYSILFQVCTFHVRHFPGALFLSFSSGGKFYHFPGVHFPCCAFSDCAFSIIFQWL